MSYLPTSGVQSAPRVMRGPGVIRPSMFDVPLVARDLMGAATDVVAGMSKTTTIMAAVGAVGLLLYLGKKK